MSLPSAATNRWLHPWSGVMKVGYIELGTWPRPQGPYSVLRERQCCSETLARPPSSPTHHLLRKWKWSYFQECSHLQRGRQLEKEISRRKVHSPMGKKKGAAAIAGLSLSQSSLANGGICRGSCSGVVLLLLWGGQMPQAPYWWSGGSSDEVPQLLQRQDTEANFSPPTLALEWLPNRAWLGGEGDRVEQEAVLLGPCHKSLAGSVTAATLPHSPALQK